MHNFYNIKFYLKLITKFKTKNNKFLLKKKIIKDLLINNFFLFLLKLYLLKFILELNRFVYLPI